MIFTDTTNISTFLPDVGPINEYPAMLTKRVTQLHTLFFSPIPSARKLGCVRCGSRFFGTQFAGDLVGTFFKKNDILLLQDGRAGLLGSDRRMH